MLVSFALIQAVLYGKKMKPMALDRGVNGLIDLILQKN
jgi:hypothetical protein